MKITCSKCGEYLELSRIGKQSYCKECHAEWMRNNRRDYAQMNHEQKKKDICRSYAGVNLRRGILQKQPCSICGSGDSQMHHADYSKPLEIIWLCRECHMDFHYQEKLILESEIKES